MGSTIRLTAEDGFEFGAYRAGPKGDARGGMIVVQEIFGVNSHIRTICDRFAAQGYVALAPQIFDRVQRDVELGYGPDDIATGRGLRGKAGEDGPILDIAACAKALAAEGLKVGTIGFCYGGALAWIAAARVKGLSCSICYYGKAADFKDESPTCPMMMHFGEQDQSIPASDADLLKGMYPDIQTFVYPAGHGFNCDLRAGYDADSATLARSRSLDFIALHVG